MWYCWGKLGEALNILRCGSAFLKLETDCYSCLSLTNYLEAAMDTGQVVIVIATLLFVAILVSVTLAVTAV